MNEQIISVFHSGSRTLREKLGCGLWHFAYNLPDIKIFQGLAHIPIRDPFNITISWEARYGDGGNDKPQAELLRQLDLQLEFVKHHRKTKLWKIEDFQEREGVGPKHWARSNRNRSKALQLQRVIDLKRWMDDERVAFYEEFYTLSWL